jgi:hypothetical protein
MKLIVADAELRLIFRVPFTANYLEMIFFRRFSWTQLNFIKTPWTFQKILFFQIPFAIWMRINFDENLHVRQNQCKLEIFYRCRWYWNICELFNTLRVILEATLEAKRVETVLMNGKSSRVTFSSFIEPDNNWPRFYNGFTTASRIHSIFPQLPTPKHS